MATRENLLLMFDRPSEPIFVPKGEKQTYFEVPQEFITDHYTPVRVNLVSRFSQEGQETIKVKKVALPNVDQFLEIGRQEPFSVFVPKHGRIAGRLISVMTGLRNLEELQSFSAYIRDRINPYLFNYALSVAILHRSDTRGMEVPNFAETFPEKFINGAIFNQVRAETSLVPAEERRPIIIPRDFTASDLEEEHRLAYFREDLGVNLHHWHWHLVYPFEGPRNIVAKDRRGELFYYMHQQIIARYNVERLCNKMNRVERLTDWRKPIKEGYYPKLDSLIASHGWPGRAANTTMVSLNRRAEEIRTDIDDMERWRDRIFDAIHSGRVRREDGTEATLDERDGFDFGIDVLGNMIEASPVLSPNQPFYGNIHNSGHLFIGYIHDPDHRHLENFGVIGESSTAMRDPAFYRWHAFIDDVFQTYKQTIPRYTVAQLGYPDITIASMRVTTEGGSDNILQTFWQQSDINLSRGMDFVPRGPVLVRFTHLQHAPFAFRFQINNSSNQQRQGTVRIFMGPKFDERGTPMLFRDHRLLFIEMDKFTVQLQPGINEISRQSNESTVTIPFERTFRDLDQNRPAGGNELAQFNFCGCGWPEHMFVPKGAPEGYPMVLFAMVSNYEGDRVDQTLVAGEGDNASFCGIRDKLYPDRRSMGYPFDRVARDGVDTLEEFLTPNMAVTDVSIRFTDRVLVRGEPGTR